MKRYWVEILLFVVIFAGLLVCLSPSYTWMNTDSDGPHYVLAAKYMLTSHHTSAPLFLLLGRLFLFIPFGTEALRMGLISVLSTMAGSLLIYLIVRRLTGKRLYACIATLIYGGSALVISQSTIVETYALSTMLMLAAYYFSIKKQWALTAIMVGLLWAVHTLFAVAVWGILLISHKQLRDVSLILLTLSFLLFYLYIPISKHFNGDLGMWGNTTFGGFFQNTYGVFSMLTGGIAIVDFPKRVLDTLGILGVSLGLGLVILTWYLIRDKKRWRNSLTWLFLFPVLWFAINLSPQTYVYLLPAVGFGAILVGIGLSRLEVSWAWATCAVAVLLMMFNVYYYDIGNRLDPEMSAVKFYKEELPKIPDGDYFMAGGWTWAMTYLYNKEENRNIIPISIDALTSEQYHETLDEMGVKYRSYMDESYITNQGLTALSIAQSNKGVWIAKETKPEVYQYVVSPASENLDYVGRWIGQEVEPELKWKPSNPYKFISGELEVKEWHHILWVRKAGGLGEMMTVILLSIYGYGLYFFILRSLRKKHAIRVEKEAEEAAR